MYQIGLFSRINHITTKTLRHYDELDLLKPEQVDYATGYRYYTNSQLPRLHKILALRQMGLSLTDIKEIIENPASIEMFLKLKQKELTDHLKKETQKLSQVRT